MKKLLSIVVLSLMLGLNANASENNNLKLIKEFHLVVDHEGQCGGENYKDELTTNAKYLFSNSKIKIKEFADEYISLSVFTLEDDTAAGGICVSDLSFQVFSFGVIENSAGVGWFHERMSYEKSAIAWHSGSTYKLRHRDAIIRAFDQYIKQLIVDWNTAQGD